MNFGNRDGNWIWPYDGSTAPVHRWFYDVDYGDWLGANKLPPPEEHYFSTCQDIQHVGGGTCLDGTFWYHAVSNVGELWDTTPAGVVVGLHGPDLANNFVDIKPDRAYFKSYSGTGLMRQVFFLIHTLPDPAPFEVGLRSRIRPLMATALGEPPHVVEDHGGSWDASELVSYGLADTLSYPGVVWASAVDPPALAAKLDERVQAMGLSEDGTFVYDTVLFDHGTLMSAGELGYDYSSQAWSVYSSSDNGSPTPRSGFVPVLSRYFGGVFVIGGRDPLTDEPVNDIDLFRPHVGWSTVMPSLPFQEAITATLSPADGKLWILGRGATRMRLYRVDPWTGESSQVGSFEYSGEWDKHFLAVDRDGQVLFVASSRNLQKTKIARLRMNLDGRAYAIQIDQDSLPYTTNAPIVDRDEYGIIVRDEAGAVTSIFRRANLLGPTGTYELDSLFQ